MSNSDSMNGSPPGSSVHGDCPGKNTGMGCHSLLQRMFPTHGLNPGLLHCRQMLYQLSYEGSHIYISSIQFSHSVVCDFLRPHEPQHARPHCPSPTPRVYSLMSIELVIPSNHLILCCPLLLLPSIFPSIRIFSNESALFISWPKYWSFSISISLSSEYSGLISFRIDWLDPLAVQGTLKSLLQHHSSKASILQCSAFFIGQLSHPYITTGKTIAISRRTFVQVMSLIFNMLSIWS